MQKKRYQYRNVGIVLIVQYSSYKSKKSNAHISCTSYLSSYSFIFLFFLYALSVLLFSRRDDERSSSDHNFTQQFKVVTQF